MEMADPVKLLIVGAGITGSILAYELKRLFADALQAGRLSVSVWDKARGSGGRMSTSRCPNSPKCQADIGAQYISYAKNRIDHDRFYTELRKLGLLESMTAPIEGANPYSGEGIEDMVAPLGMSSLVKYFLSASGFPAAMQRELNSIIESSAGKLAVSTTSGHTEEFDGVVLTMPVPQIFKLGGSFCDQNHLSQLERKAVQYSTRFTLVLFFPDKTDIGLKFGFQFVDDDDMIRYVSIDNAKRGRRDEPVALVVHSTWQFGKKHIEARKEDVEELLLNRVYERFPQLPRTESRKIHKWRYAQVRARTEAPSEVKHPAAFFVLNYKPLVVCAGDGFTDSSFDGCLESARAASLFLSDHLLDSK